MPRTHPAYPPEYRLQLVELVRAGRSPEELAREFGPTAPTIRNWVKQADLDEGRRQDGLTTVECGELLRLRRDLRQAASPRAGNPGTPSRCPSGKAAAWFARETGSIPPESSSS